MIVGPLVEEAEKPKAESREALERKRVKMERVKAVWRSEVERRTRTWRPFQWPSSWATRGVSMSSQKAHRRRRAREGRQGVGGKAEGSSEDAPRMASTSWGVDFSSSVS